MSGISQLAARIRGGLGQLLIGFLALVLVGLVLLDASQVVMRYVFLRGFAWGAELAIIMLITLAWIGAPLLWLKREHLTVDFALHFLGPPGMRRLNFALDMFALVGGLYLAFMTAEAIRLYGGIDLPALGTSAAVKYYPILVGAGLLSLAGLLNILADLAIGPAE